MGKSRQVMILNETSGPQSMSTHSLLVTDQEKSLPLHAFPEHRNKNDLSPSDPLIFLEKEERELADQREKILQETKDVIQ